MSPLTNRLRPLETLPHRYPFLLVDRMSVVEHGRHAVGTKMVTGGEGYGVDANDWRMTSMPHTLVVEALAQLSGAILVGLADGATGVIGYFLGIDNVRFRGAARPGDIVDLDVRLLQYRRGMCKTRGVARVGSLEIVRADLTTVLRRTQG